jgi:fibronectin-binding autotransporter adhesin
MKTLSFLRGSALLRDLYSRNRLKGWTSLVAFSVVGIGSAATITWNGGGGDDNWSTVANWVTAAPVNGDALVFSGATRPSNTNNFLTSVGAVTFGNGGFSISGNALTLAGDFTNSGNNTWSINSTLSGARTLTSNSGVLTLSGQVNLSSNLLTIGGAGNTTVSGVVGGSGGLLKSGSGVLVLSNTNVYTGSTRISGGSVSITADTNLGAVPVSATPGSIVIDGGILTTTGTFTLSSNRGIALGPVSGQGDGTINVSSGELTYNGILSSNTGTGNLVKTGTGILTLGGSNSYSGNTVISAGTLKVGSATAIPSGVSKGDLVLDSTLDLNGNNVTVNGFSGSGSGLVTTGLAGLANFTVGSNNKSGVYNGVIQNGSGTVGFIKTGTGTVTLGGANTFTGGVSILGGTLQVANPSALNNGTPNTLTFGANAAVGTKFQLNGNSVTIGALSTNATPGTVVVENANAAAATLTVSQATNTTFAGVLQNGTGGGVLSLTKAGSGTLTISGSNIYTGDTTVSAGTLQAGSATAIPSGAGTGNVILNGGASAGILDINGFDLSLNGLTGTTGAVLGKVVNNGTGTTKTVTVGSGDATTTFAGLIANNTGTGGILNLTKTGAGTLTLSNANTYTGSTAIRNGSVVLGIANALPSVTSLTLGDGTTNTSGILKLNGFGQTLSGLTTAGSGIANSIINGSATAVSLTLNTTANSSFGGILGGPGTNENNFNLVKTGVGTLTLSGANTYSGTTNISQGIISTGNLTNALGSGSSLVVLGDATNTGTLSYTGSSATFSRGFTVSAGGGQIDATTTGQTLTLVTGNIGTSGAFTLGGAGNTAITSNVTGSGSLNKTGAGNLTVSGANTYSGATNIFNGSVILGVDNTGLNSATALTLGDATANTNGVLKLDGHTQTLTSLLKVGNGTGNRVVGGNTTASTLTLNNAGNINFGGILGGSATSENNLALVKTAAGTLTLSGVNTYTGNTTVSAGTVSISAANNLGATTGILNLGAGTLQTTASFTSTRAINLTSATSALSINSGITLTNSGGITGTGNLNLTGLGNLLLSGTNTYSGATNLQNGTLTLGAVNALPTATVLTLGSGANSGKLILNGFSQTVSGLSTSGTGTTNSIVNGKVTAVILTIDNASNTAFSGLLGGTGTNENAFALTKSNTGILTLSGANTYSGNTTLSAGTLQLGSATALPSGIGKGNLDIAASTTLDIASFAPTLNGLSGSGIVTSSVAGPKTLSVGSNDQTSIFSGVIQNGAGTVSLNKVGTGTLTLSGTNTYTGNTTVTLGTLKVGSINAIPSGLLKGNLALTGSLDLNGNSITVNGLSGTGGISSSVAGTMTLSAGANDQTSSYSGVISNGTATSLGLTKVGTLVLTLSGANTYSGDTTISAGTLKFGGNNTLPSGVGKGNLIISSGGTLDLGGRSSGNAIINALTGSGIVTNTTAGTGVLTIGTVTNAASTFNGNLQDGTGLVGLVKAGTGTLTLTPTTGNNSFTGGITINGGILQAGNANAFNSAGTNVVTFITGAAAGTNLQVNGNAITIAGLASGATTGSPVVENANATAGSLTIKNTAAFTYAGVIQDGTGGGSLALVKDGSGTETLTGTNTYTGGTTITSGILSINKDAALGATSGALSIGNGKLQVTAGIASTPRSIAVTNALSAIVVDPGITYIEAGIISGTGTLNKEGKGILQLTGSANTYSGGTTVSAGLLDITSTAALGTPLGTGNVSVSPGGNLSLSSIFNKGALQTITVTSTPSAKGGIGFSNTALTQAQLVGMFTDSTGTDGGVLSINNGITYSAPISLATLGGGNWFLGSAATGTFAGAAANLTVGAGNTYRLGGGGGTLTLSQAGVLTGNNDVLVGSNTTNGNGTIIVPLAQTYTGKTTVTGGAILSIGLDTSLGNAPSSFTAGKLILDGGILQARAAITISPLRGISLGPTSGSGTGTIDTNGNTVTYAGIIADNGGTGSLTKIGTGTLALSGQASTYTGATNLNGGTTSFTGIQDLGLGTAINFNGGTLLYGAGNTADITARTVTTTAAGGAIIDIGANNVSFSTSAITGTGALTKQGTGTLTLNVVNTYAGATTLSAGTVKLGINGALPATSALTINSSSLDINGLDTTLSNLAGNATGNLINSVGTANTVTVNSTVNSTFSGIIAGNGIGGGTIALVKTGGSTLTLSGSNTYTGGTTLSAGTLSIAADANLGTAPVSAAAGNIILNGGTLSTSANMTLNANRGIAIGPSGATAGILAPAAGTTLTYNGIIANSGTGTGGLTKSNTTGTLVLGGSNTYAGDTTISGGTLRIANTTAIPSGTGKGNVVATGTLDLNGNAITINGLSGAGTITSGIAGAAGITVGDTNASSSYTGTIVNGTGTVSLGKIGTGILTLSGANTYTGGTTISAGAISISADNQIGSSTTGTLVLNGGALNTTANLTLSATRGIAVGPTSGSGSGILAPATGTTLTYGGIIANNGSGTGGLTKSATTGTLVLSGANTYSGDTSILGGTLQLGNIAAIPSGTGKGNLALASGTTLDLNNLSPTVNGLSGSGTITNSLTAAVTLTTGGNNATSTFSGIVQDGNGTTSLTKIGTGTLTLSGVSAYTGLTTISSGTLQLGIASALPSGLGKGNLVLNGALDLNGFSNTLNGLSGSGTVTNSSTTAATLTAGAADQTSTFSGNLQNGIGSTALIKTGTGTLTLSGNNTFSGATTISAGTLAMGSATGLSANSTLTIASAGTLDVNGFSITMDGLLGTGTINNNGATPSTLTTGAGNASTQFDGVIANGTNTIALTKTGTGTLTLTGVNTYSGTTTIANGTVSVANPGIGGNLGTATTPIILGDSTNKGTLAYTANADLLFTRGFDVNAGGGQMNITSPGKTLTLQTGAITTTGTFTVGGAGNAVVSSVISGSGGFTKANTGSLILSGANTYTGDTTISTGTLQLGTATAIPSGTGKGNVIVNGTLDLNNFAVTLNGLSGSGTVTNTLGSPIALTLGGNNASANFSGTLQDGAGTTSLIKIGTGTQTLSGINTFSGDTTLSTGTLKIGNNAALPSGSGKGNLTLAAAGILDLNDFDQTLNGLTGSGLITNNAGASLLTTGANNQTSTFTGNIQDGLGTIGLTKTGTGTLSLSGNNTFSGATTISAGTVTLGSDTALSAASSLTIGNAGTLDLNGRIIAIDGLAGTGSLTNNSATPVTLTTGSSGGSGTFGGTLNDGLGTIALIKTGAGTVTLTNANTYSGGTLVTGGLLAITADAALGVLPATPNPGNITLNGGGLSATNTFTLSPNRGITLGPATGSGSATLDTALNQTLTYAGVIANNATGTGSLIKTGTGTLTLGGANTYTGDTTITAGAIQIGNDLALPGGSGKGNVSLTGILDLNDHDIAINGLTGTGTVTNTHLGSASIAVGNNDQTSTFSGTLQDGIGTTDLTKTGTGTLTLSGTSTYTGTTLVSVGTLLVNGSLGNTATAVASGATLGGTGNLGGNVTVNGTLAPGPLNAIGTLGMNSLDLVDTYSVQWNGLTDTIDNINVSNLLKLGSGSTLMFSSIGGTLTQSAYIFATYGSLDSSLNQFGTVSNLPVGYTIDYHYGLGMNQIALVIPEPNAAGLAVVGTLLLLAQRRRRSRP